jgi:hypothetical protein
MNVRGIPRVVLGAVLVLVVATPAARAESSLYGGPAFPTGELANATTAGFSFGGYLTGPVLPWLEVGGNVAYNDFTVDTTQPGAGAQFGPTLSAWEFHALGQAEVAFLQLFLGLGAANYSGRDDAGESQRQTDFAWQAGAAARWYFMEFRLGYHQITTDGVHANWIGVTFGVIL